MATFQFDGQVEVINDKSITAKSTGQVYNSKEIIISTVNENYPQTYKVEVREKDYQKIQNLAVGTVATFHTNVNGRRWDKPDGTTDAFVSLSLWKYEQAGQASTPASFTTPPPVVPTSFAAPTQPTATDDDLPF